MTVLRLGTVLAAFAVASPAWGAWTLSDDWQASDRAGNDRFAITVALSGERALIGANFAQNGPVVDSGAAYLYDISNPFSVGGELKLVGSDTVAGDEFGGSVALAGNIAVAGASKHNGGKGAAYVFDAATGQQLHKLSGGTNNWYGNDVATNGSVVVVANYLGDHVYLYDAQTGGQLAAINDGNGSSDNYGWSIDISGNTLAVGSLKDGGSGAVYLFDITDPTAPQLKSRLHDASLAAGVRFGDDVSIAGNLAVVGTQADVAYLYDIQDLSNPVLLGTLTQTTGGTFGETIVTDGSYVIVSDDRQGAGTTWIYDAQGNLLQTITPHDGVANDRFGQAMAIDGGNLLIGAWGFDNPASTAGKAYLYVVPEPASLALFAAGALLIARRRR